MRLFKRAGAAMIAALLAACQSGAAESPAVLESADAQTIAAVQAALAEAVGRAHVELGPGDLTRRSSISVLPPPLGPHEDRSTATPVIFDLMLRGGQCYAVRRDTGEAFALNGVTCVAA